MSSMRVSTTAKSFLADFVNPLVGLDAGLLGAELVLFDFEALAECYEPRLNRYQRARQAGWLVLLAVPVACGVWHRQIREDEAGHAPPPPPATEGRSRAD